MKYKYILAYLRLSQDDLDKTDESNSIQNQRLLIQQFVGQKEELWETEILYFVDDGYTGTNFERPGFKNMMELLSTGDHYCIVVKDFSRLGRDTVQTQNYIEKVFPFMGIRFISINDFYDSSEDSLGGINTEVKFKNLVNGIYPEICSKNIKQILRKRAENGKYMGAFPVYGYRFAEDSYSRLEIDEPAARVVREIFKLRLEKLGMSDIARQLNEKKTPSPAKYMTKYGKLPEATETSAWTYYSVRHILENVAYTGTVESHKTETVITSQKKTINIPKEERICVPDMHTAIVSKEIFEAVNAMKETRPFTGIPGKQKGKRKEKKRSVFIGILKCGHCKKNMRFRIGEPRMKYGKISCYTARFTLEFGCYRQSSRLDELEEVVLHLVIQQAAMADASIKALDKMDGKTETLLYKAKLKNYEREIEKNNNQRCELYEKFASGFMTKEEYLAQKEIVTANVMECKEIICGLQEKIKALENHKKQYQNLKNIAKYADITVLSQQVVDELIEEILFYDPEHIEVIWKYRDEVLEYFQK